MRLFNTIFVFIIITMIIMMKFKITTYTHTSVITATVSDKERITQSDGENGISSFYLVYTDKGTFKLEDDIFRGNWESSDVYGSLKTDSTYTFTTSGYRFGFFSMYPNIINVE